MLKFTPLEFKTTKSEYEGFSEIQLKFTPLEFKTLIPALGSYWYCKLKFTPLEFKTGEIIAKKDEELVKIYSVGV